MSFANYKWFEEWKDDKVKNREAEYKELKQAFIDTTLDMVMDIFPKITRDKVTPLSARNGRRREANHKGCVFNPDLNIKGPIFSPF